ncbi:EAL domain-containing protein [Asticcacaulis sp.]|uniref:EAL domain-containing protein n=1 Tax=Asticcacaulis sp. TaxID=1872648 RepID=UPI00345B32DF
MQVVAEGVETPRQHQHLKAAGVHAMQGYLFSRPLRIDALIARLSPAPLGESPPRPGYSASS